MGVGGSRSTGGAPSTASETVATTRRRAWNCKETIVLVLPGTALTTAAALAQQVGTATAVNPETRTTPPGGADRKSPERRAAPTVHTQGTHKTTPTRSVQLLFLYRGALSIAPNSKMLIDKFVYNPRNGSGHMAVSVAKGAMRLVGGQLSHAGEATVNAGNATIGIRGGTGIFTTKEVINLNGTFTPNNCPPVKRILPCLTLLFEFPS